MKDKKRIIILIFKFMEDEEKQNVMDYIKNFRSSDYFEFKSMQQVNSSFDDKINEFLTDLNQEDILLLRMYTGYKYRNINAILRDDWNYDINGLKTDDIKKEYEDIAEQIDNIIYKFPKLNLKFKTFRGTTLSYFKDYNVNNLKDLKSLSGEFIYEPGFTSTSIVKNNDFFNKQNDLGLNYNIRIVYSIDGNYKDGALLYNDSLSYSKGQTEFIINKSSLSYVNEVIVDENNNEATIYVTLIPTEIWDKRRYEMVNETKSIC